MISKNFLFLTAVILLAAWLRLDFLAANNFVIDSDEAIVGLMAKHIYEGKSLPVFYYGQHYMGSLEALCVAALFSVFSISAVCLKIVPFAFSLLLILLIYELTVRTVSQRAAGIAAVLCAVPPSTLLVWSSMARGGFIEILVIGCLAFVFLARWLEQAKPGLKLVFIIGIILGLGWWVNNQILYFMIPAAFVMAGNILWQKNKTVFARLRELTAVSFTGLTAWLMGGWPYWKYNIENDWASMGMFEVTGNLKIFKNLTGLYEKALPILLGGARFWQAEDFYPGSVSIVIVIYSSILLACLWIRRESLKNLLLFRFGKDSFPDILILFLLTCCLVFVVSSFGWLSQAPRYLLPMYVGILPLVALVADRIMQRSFLIGSFLLGLILCQNLASAYFGGRALPGEPIVYEGERVSKDHSQLIAWLDHRNIKWIRTNYWIGYRLAFESAERIRFIVIQEPSQTRIESWVKETEHIPPEAMPLVVVPAQAKYIRRALSLMQIAASEEIVSGYHVFFNLQYRRSRFNRIDSSNLEISSSVNPLNIAAAVDGNLHTRWGTARPQDPQMEVRVKFRKQILLDGIMYDMGEWPQDYPRELQIEFVKADGSSFVFLDKYGWRSMKHLLEMNSEIPLFFEPLQVQEIIFRQTGRHPVFDWSIAELTLFGEVSGD